MTEYAITQLEMARDYFTDESKWCRDGKFFKYGEFQKLCGACMLGSMMLVEGQRPETVDSYVWNESNVEAKQALLNAIVQINPQHWSVAHYNDNSAPSFDAMKSMFDKAIANLKS